VTVTVLVGVDCRGPPRWAGSLANSLERNCTLNQVGGHGQLRVAAGKIDGRARIDADLRVRVFRGLHAYGRRGMPSADTLRTPLGASMVARASDLLAVDVYHRTAICVCAATCVVASPYSGSTSVSCRGPSSTVPPRVAVKECPRVARRKRVGRLQDHGTIGIDARRCRNAPVLVDHEPGQRDIAARRREIARELIGGRTAIVHFDDQTRKPGSVMGSPANTSSGRPRG